MALSAVVVTAVGQVYVLDQRRAVACCVGSANDMSTPGFLRQAGI